MKNILRISVAFAFLFLASISLQASHNRAGDIVIEQIGGCTSNMVRCSVFIYTKTSSPIDRPEMELFWGDGSSELALRTNNGGFGEVLGNDISVNIYVAEHTYDGPGQYEVSIVDPKRNEGIINVNGSASGNVDFFLSTKFTLFGGQNQGCNNTPRLENQPIDYACIGEIYVHNPGAYDPDGDLLTYELFTPQESAGNPVPFYTFPTEVAGSSDTTSLTIDEVSGTITWMVPEIAGEYNVAFIVISWRDGIPIDTTIRDMQIEVFDCDDNKAPKIETIDEICVIAGEVVEFNVIASDPNAGDQIKLSAVGAPFLLEVSPASNADTWRPFGMPSAVYEDQVVVKTFRWQTACEHISDLSYTVVFKAEDDFSVNGVLNGLAFSKAVRIKVVGPPPLDVQSAASSDQIEVSWERPYVCENAADDFFLSFSVWRKENGDNIPLDNCKPGLEGTGYVWQANTVDISNGRYFYIDTNVERGRTYCYRILARFAKRTDAGQPYNIVESLPSDKTCLQLNREVPLITHVTVNETATANGQMEIRWVKPVATDLDTLLNPGPYRYELLRASGLRNGNFETIANFSSPTFYQLTQNQFVDQVPALDTKGNPYHYRLAFYVNDETEPLGLAADASSVFLEIDPTDNRNELNWQFDVPWSNTTYDVYRWNGVIWDSIATVQDTFYTDQNLINGQEYCYYIKAYGTYGLAEIPSPLINFSQEACAVPRDDVAPCAPILTVANICDKMESCDEAELLENTLSWEKPEDLCPESDDVASYQIYFSEIEGGEFILIGTVGQEGITEFMHQPDRGLAGCYAVSALDSAGNESPLSNVICVDNCPNFSLPNTFTPNGDGSNDLFTPYPFCFIERIELNVFNRWGEMVFETRDPNINWTGMNFKGKDLPAGTYYYVCKVYEQRVAGIVEAPGVLNGYIDIIR